VEDKKVKGKLFDKPQGPAKRIWRLNGYYISDDITCQACGTMHSRKDLKSDSDESYDYSIIDDGIIVVDKCCGAEIDRRFETIGQAFFIQMINDFIHDPLAEKYSFVRRNIEIALTAWNKIAKKAPKEPNALKRLLPKI
jgi:hypothetical protein